MKTNIRNNLRRMKKADVFSSDYIRAEANIGNGLKTMITVWSELAEDTRNKTEWNNFAKYVLKEIQEFGEVIKNENE
jgi:hypothetical protein